MKTFKEEIAELLSPYVGLSVAETYRMLTLPQHDDQGHFSFPCFSLAKSLKKAPSFIAQELAKSLNDLLQPVIIGNQMKTFSTVLAADKNGGIGKNNRLPWQGKLKTDMAFFKELTTSQHQSNIITKYILKDGVFLGHQIAENEHKLKNAVIMGRKTWDSIPKKFKPLEDRLNIVLSRTTTNIEGAVCYDSLDRALESLQSDPSVGHVFVIGGSQVYQEAFRHSLCESVFITTIDSEFECDTYLDFKDLTSSFSPVITSKVITENEISYMFKILTR